MEEVVRRADVGIDLHSAAIHRTNLPQVRVSPADKVTQKMALDFGAPVVLTSPLRDGSLRAVAAKQGTPILLYEAGEGLRFDEMAVRAGLAGILRVMRGQDMLPAKGIARARSAPYICTASHWLRAPAGGLLRTFRAEGETVAEGDLLAIVVSRIRASHRGAPHLLPQRRAGAFDRRASLPEALHFPSQKVLPRRDLPMGRQQRGTSHGPLNRPLRPTRRQRYGSQRPWKSNCLRRTNPSLP